MTLPFEDEPEVSAAPVEKRGEPPRPPLRSPVGKIHHGDCLIVLPTFEPDSIDACVTDPPYGIGFMGKEWDNFRRSRNPNDISRDSVMGRMSRSAPASGAESDMLAFQLWTEQWAREILRVLKPGGHALVCGATRSYHRMASGLEDAGFEIRDCLAWLYGSGFPKSLNLGEGLGTALKPAYEPIVLARKPFTGTVKANVEKYGTGALNIDACRIDTVDNLNGGAYTMAASDRWDGADHWRFKRGGAGEYEQPQGRWPANVITDDLAAQVIDEQSGELISGTAVGGLHRRSNKTANCYGEWKGERTEGDVCYGDTGGASRFFYCAKPSREERDYGCEGLDAKTAAELTNRKPGSAGLQNPRAGIRAGSADRDIAARVARNFHPTVKPVELMRWLVKLVTPMNGIVLDPFLGSGTTGMAARYEQRSFIGIEREADYISIAERRIAAVAPLFAAVDE